MTNTNEKKHDSLTFSCTLLGCDKNRVDAEKFISSLIKSGYEIVGYDERADVHIINTCAFIQSARLEAINEITRAVYLKNSGLYKKVVVTGCFPEIYFDELKNSYPEVDLFVKIKDNVILPQLINKLFSINSKTADGGVDRFLTTPKHYAFLKISDGCNNCCSYCTIPRIRGRFVSQKMEDLTTEAKKLSKQGVTELILVAQDVTRYGIDIYGENKLVCLLQKLIDLKLFKRIRLHYLYPESITDELLNFMDSHDEICKYLDIPLQHVNDKILRLMNRRSNKADIIKLIEKIRKLKHRFSIRTSFIIGYPGESGKDFGELLSFLNEYKLDNVGFFAYSKEERTPAYYQKNHVSKFIKNKRLKKATKQQLKISNEINAKRLGSTVVAIADSFDETTGNYFFRDEYNSPDIDYIIKATSDNIKLGCFYKIKLTNYHNFEFEGEIENEYTK